VLPIRECTLIGSGHPLVGGLAVWLIGANYTPNLECLQKRAPRISKVESPRWIRSWQGLDLKVRTSKNALELMHAAHQDLASGFFF